MDASTAYTTTPGCAIVGRSRGCPAKLHFDTHTPRETDGQLLAARRVFTVMGFLTDGIQYWPQVEYLCTKGYIVITFDNRGVGRSTSSTPPYRTSQMALDALELMESLNWDPETTHLIGISMGGMICLEMLTRRMFRSTSLLVTTPTGPFHQPFPWNWGGPPLTTFFNVFRQLFDPTISDRESSLMSMSLSFRRDWLLQDSGQVHRKTGISMTNLKRVMRIGTKIWFAKKEDGIDPRPNWRGVMGQMFAVGSHYVSPKRLKRIREANMPILVVGATDDKQVKMNTGSIMLNNLLNPREFLVLESGHAVNIECADQVNEALLRLFKTAETSAPTRQLRAAL